MVIAEAGSCGADLRSIILASLRASWNLYDEKNQGPIEKTFRGSNCSPGMVAGDAHLRAFSLLLCTANFSAVCRLTEKPAPVLDA
jgi:hypothetical protein